ncbi:MAG: hypothetical protein AB1733_20940, partial [Thermodesulfobacteriota bacterium]
MTLNDLVVDGTNTVPYLHRSVRGESAVGTVGAGLGNCLRTRHAPNIVARLGVDAWKGTLTPTLSQRERERKESPLPRFGGE